MRRFVPVLLFLAMALAAFGAIRSYDLFWQLATGRWIVEHRALPHVDPFTVASDRTGWVDGEWLYEVVIYLAHGLAGLKGLSVLRGLLAALIFTIAFFASRRENDANGALVASAVGFAGAMQVLDLRPSGVAALMLVLMLAARTLPLRIIVTVLWMNVHPSALLAPVIALLSRPDSALDREFRPAPRVWEPVLHAAACAAALLVNPFGWKGVIAPLELARFVSSGAFVNAEWLPSAPARFPVLYAAIAIAVIAFVLAERREWRHFVLLAIFAALAVRSVRNQPLFFAAFATLVPMPRLRPAIAYAASAIAVAIVAIAADHRPGVPPERFPIEAVARLQSTGLRGNVYNPDQFGGYLIWSFYPERRALTDGRNELYRSFIPKWQAARTDQRKWDALLREYRIDLAVEEYRPPLNVIDASTGRPTAMPASLAYWPRKQWALIGYDRAAMVFARRAAFPGIEKWELHEVPDAPLSRD